MLAKHTTHPSASNRAPRLRRSRSRGFGVLGMLLTLGPWVLLGYCALLLLPLYSDNQAVQRAAQRAAGEGPSVYAVRQAFDKALSVDRIDAIRGNDLSVSTNGDGKTVVTYSYQRDVQLFREVHLLLKFDGRATAR